MPRRRPHEEHANHEAWAIPYGDLVTLLLAFFVVMYAMSTLNEGKYRVLSEALNAEFQGPQKSTSPIQVGEPQRGQGEHVSAIEKKALLEGASTPIATPPEVRQEVPKAEPKEAIKNAAATPAEELAGNAQELNKVADDVEQAMSTLIHENLVTVRRHGLWIEVEIQTDILFPSGVATLSPLATSLLSPLADSLQPFPNPIRVEGHTDNVPIIKRDGGGGSSWPSNWELSAARAASVVRLFATRGVAPTRLTVIGLGEFRPVQSNSTSNGRNANRRVVLVILGSDGMPVGTHGHQAGPAELPPEQGVAAPAIANAQ
jgi:chemotaxis protein MotB